MAPTLAAFCVGFIWPFIHGLYLSFCQFTTVDNAKFVGISNYTKALADTSFIDSFWFTVAFVIVATLIINVTAFAIALALTKELKGTNIFRTVFFMPNLIGGIVLGYIWQSMINGVLSKFGVTMLFDAKYGFWGLIILMNWQMIGYIMIIYIAGLQNIPVLSKFYMADSADAKISSFKFISNIGLVLFVTSVGLIAGPKFFGNMKKNFKSYVFLGLIIIVAGGLVAVGCVYAGKLMGETDMERLSAIISGIFAGALTSTPAFSAAKASVATPELEQLVSVGYGIAYIFGVIGVVLFVQLLPKLLKVNMDEERAKLVVDKEGAAAKKETGKLIELDDFGIAPFAIAAVIGVAHAGDRMPCAELFRHQAAEQVQFVRTGYCNKKVSGPDSGILLHRMCRTISYNCHYIVFFGRFMCL